MQSGASESRFGRLLTVGREYLTHWVIAGTFIVLTGFAPEHWVADLLSHLALPERIRHALQPALDIRVGLVTIGVAIIAWDVLRRSKFQKEATLRDSGIEAPYVSLTPARSANEQKLIQATNAAQLALPDKPSIAILPFQNMSGDPEQEYFADGIVEAITSGLSRIRSFFVIARNSAFTYKGRAVNVRDIGSELGVAYLLEGSVQKAGDRLRITVQLIETEGGAHVWTAHYDGTIDDVFNLEDRITEQVAGALQPSIRIAEIERSRRKRPQDLEIGRAHV